MFKFTFCDDIHTERRDGVTCFRLSPGSPATTERTRCDVFDGNTVLVQAFMQIKKGRFNWSMFSSCGATFYATPEKGGEIK